MQKLDVNKLRVASPCSVGWDTMTGDERVRHCHSCQLNIYNTAEMPTAEIQNLIENREGRLCIRMYRRSDGTVLTKDCPVGLRAIRKRVSVFAGAAMSAILGLFSISFAQSDEQKQVDKPKVKITQIKRDAKSKDVAISGIVTDINGAVISNSRLKLTGKENFSMILYASDDGEFVITGLIPGKYDLEIEVRWTPFEIRRVEGINVDYEHRNDLVIRLEAKPSETIGIMGFPLDPVTTKIPTDVITMDIRKRP